MRRPRKKLVSLPKLAPKRSLKDMMPTGFTMHRVLGGGMKPITEPPKTDDS